MRVLDGSAGVAVYNPVSQCVLMGERTDGQGWGLAGGKIEPGETSMTAAWRELFEEFGLAAITLEYVGRVIAQCKVCGELCTVVPAIYVCKHWKGEPTAQESEVRQLAWMSVTQLLAAKEGILFPPSAKAIKLCYERGFFDDRGY